MPAPPSEEPLDVGEQAVPSQPGVASPRGATSPLFPRRNGSPRAAADGAATVDGPRKFVDFRMEAAPTWDGEMPETKYRLDGIPFGSRLAALTAHLSVEDITSDTGYELIVKIIEDAHDYLRDAKLEQAFESSIKHGALARVSLNSLRSHRLRRVVKASLGCEALAMDDGLSELEWLRAMYVESCVPDSQQPATAAGLALTWTQ